MGVELGDQRAGAVARLDLGQIGLRQRQGDLHRLDLGDHHQRRGAARADKIAGLDQNRSGLAGYRRTDFAVAQIKLGGGDLGPIGGDGGGRGFGGGVGGVFCCEEIAFWANKAS